MKILITIFAAILIYKLIEWGFAKRCNHCDGLMDDLYYQMGYQIYRCRVCGLEERY